MLRDYEASGQGTGDSTRIGITIGFRCTAVSTGGGTPEDYLYEMDVLYYTGTKVVGTTKSQLTITTTPIGFSDTTGGGSNDIAFHIKNASGVSLVGKYLLQKRYYHTDPGEVQSP